MPLTIDEIIFSHADNLSVYHVSIPLTKSFSLKNHSHAHTHNTDMFQSTPIVTFLAATVSRSPDTFAHLSKVFVIVHENHGTIELVLFFHFEKLQINGVMHHKV